MFKIKHGLLCWGLGVVIGNGVVLTVLGALGTIKMFIEEPSLFTFFIMVISVWSAVATVAVAPVLNKHFKTIRDSLMEN